jgi:hypothetical protein
MPRRYGVARQRLLDFIPYENPAVVPAACLQVERALPLSLPASIRPAGTKDVEFGRVEVRIEVAPCFTFRFQVAQLVESRQYLVDLLVRTDQKFGLY